LNPDERLSAREIAIQEFNSLRGRLCTVIESACLPKKQEKALVTLIKQLSYQNQAVIAGLIEILDKDNQSQFQYIGQKVKQIDNEVR
jgi:hypothetical protein